MKLFAPLATAITAALLAGCDPISGTERTVTVARLPTPAVVMAALQSVPDVEHVTLRQVPAVTQLGLGIEHQPAFNQFTFGTGTIWATVETKQDAQGTNSLRLYSLWIHSPPPKAEFDRARALLDAAYLSLRRSVPSLPPPQEVKETLIDYPSK